MQREERNSEEQKQNIIETATETKISGSAPSELLAICSKNNKISIIDMNTEQQYALFGGAQRRSNQALAFGAFSWTQIREIPNSNLMVSLNHVEGDSTSLQLYNISQKGNVSVVYAFEEAIGNRNLPVSGGGYRDVAYNSRRSCFAAISLRGRVAYHLFEIKNASNKSGYTANLLRKSKWPDRYLADNVCITDIDFNPNGEFAASIDRNGVYLLSDIDTHSYKTHLFIGIQADGYASCKWSTNAEESLLFIKCDRNYLNILDTERKTKVLKRALPLAERQDYIFWIDVCGANGNLLAAGSEDGKVLIYDRRESKIVKSFDEIHTGSVNCVRWDPTGERLATASDDKTAKAIDAETGKVIHSSTTPDQKFACSACFL